VLPAGDDQLVRELYAQHAAALLGFVRPLVGGDRGRAEDIVQETLIRAWRHPEALDPGRRGGASVRGWLFTVARNLAIDGWRARSARPNEVQDLAERAGGEDVRLDQILIGLEMQDALGSLSADHRAVVDQLYYRDRSVADAAIALGVPVGTVKSRAYYALRALRVACEERGVTP